MFLHSNGWGYTTYTDAFLKYPQRFFFGSGANTTTGSIIVGPYPGSSALSLGATDPFYYWPYVQGQVEGAYKDYIISFWCMPIAIPTTQSIYLVMDNTVPPNLTTTAVVQITPTGQLLLGAGFGDNVFVFPAHWAVLNPNAIYIQSKNLLPFNAWTHVCMQWHFAPPGNPPQGRVNLYINGCLDTASNGVGFPTPALGGSNAVGFQFKSDGTSQIAYAEYLVTDTTAPTNNTAPISPTAQIDTIFPNANGSLNGWTPSAGTQFSCVNGNPGPGPDHITAGTDQTFLIPALTPQKQNLAVALNMALSGVSLQNVAGLFKVPTQSPVAISPNIVATSAVATAQAFTELNLFTGLPWTDAAIAATEWGVRAISGSGEQISQYFLERIWQDGPAECQGSYTW